MGFSAIFEGRLSLVLCYHSMEIDAIPPPCISLKQCVSISSVYQMNIIRGWLHVIINIQTLIHDKVNVFFLIRDVEKPASIGSPGADGGVVE